MKPVVAVMAVVLVLMTIGTTFAQSQGMAPTDSQRRECERNGGYWVTAAGYCKIGA
jgi:hypothetical protein